ncbi:XTP/dITP diphosphohydrolase [Leifsonia sp. 98AMF]|uniref:RdgB/HAM1 family non-canonical purine NTP pyrophosphatase n=1 Tax=unclassified Leifsonia TaxID=2663824 RepID=UPI00087DE1AB|nr:MULTISPECIES: RdgB/HAM1 family non-canonical purine NTP pyrophosphatase [unclassified Leifsonia]SDH27871.1 XTP/dITP diphosphohydrolase [Leifsonia sp. 197AMF]SDJ10573.1 XTP/dITP diphosphohydrolase [Leifsonia sp. 466MF]SDJ59667.1 XTP/dITP diphosphohydrolase [Leifsonia sp. 157MF]SDN31890.1 XTP/dITP diphosphohydrolase [Leifsonia sp. 509MF]SEM89553.1 XTP/dITP diphosphohydrolase [Leifsonia sp. 467MF]
MVRVVLATHNQHKAREFQQILGREVPGLEIVAYDGPEPVEDGVSFEENALIKARAAVAHTGLPALADDSGICVDVMGGAPGIFSARWAGSHGDAAANLRLLLDQLADIPGPDRAAHFTATLALVTPGGEPTVVQGIWPGSIAREPRGENGHGYDPIFVPDGHDVTAAELEPSAKNAESHRARALSAIVPALRELGES